MPAFQYIMLYISENNDGRKLKIFSFYLSEKSLTPRSNKKKKKKTEQQPEYEKCLPFNNFVFYDYDLLITNL